jgi:hypothetical protein
MENYKFLLIISDSNVISTAIIKLFKCNSTNWKILSLETNDNKEVDKCIQLTYENYDNLLPLYSEIESFSKIYHAIIHISGGWIRGSIRNPDIFTQSDNMFKKNYYPCLLGKRISVYNLSWSFG